MKHGKLQKKYTPYFKHITKCYKLQQSLHLQ